MTARGAHASRAKSPKAAASSSSLSDRTTREALSSDNGPFFGPFPQALSSDNGPFFGPFPLGGGGDPSSRVLLPKTPTCFCGRLGVGREELAAPELNLSLLVSAMPPFRQHAWGFRSILWKTLFQKLNH